MTARGETGTVASGAVLDGVQVTGSAVADLRSGLAVLEGGGHSMSGHVAKLPIYLDPAVTPGRRTRRRVRCGCRRRSAGRR